MNAYADDDLVPILHPYKGLTARSGKREINVHEVKDGIVYYGLYDEDADDCPFYCLGLYQLPVEAFIDRLGGHMARGDAAVFTLLDNSEPFALRSPTSTRG